MSFCISEFQRPQQRLLECTDGPQIESVTTHWLLFSSTKKRSPQLEESSTQMLLQCIKTLVQWQHCLSMNSWISIAGLATCGDLQTQHGFALSTRHTKHKYTVSKTEDKRKKKQEYAENSFLKLIKHLFVFLRPQQIPAGELWCMWSK